MRPQEYMELIWKLEQQCKFDTWCVGGVDIWPAVRFQLANELRTIGDKTHKRTTSQNSPRGMRKWLRAIQAQHQANHNDSKHNANPKQQVQVLVLHHSSYRSLAGETYHDRLLDYLREELASRGITSLGLEYCPSGAFRTPRALPTHYIQSELYIENLRNRLDKFFQGPTISRRIADLQKYDANGVEKLLIEIEQAGITRYWNGMLAANHVIMAGLLIRMANLFTRYLKSTGAELAITTYYYSMEGMALCFAARQLGIPCIDVQHGVQGHYHFAYGPWQCMPKHGFNTLPTIYWCWDAESAVALEQGVNPHTTRVITGGNPWQAFWEDEVSSVVASELKRINSVIKKHHGRKHILLSLQWDHGLTEQLRDLIAASPPDYHWWVRPHPVQTGGREAIRGTLEYCGPGRYELDLAADAPLPLLLTRLDVHVTRSSTVVREAAQIGMRSVTLDPTARDHYKNELESGLAIAADSREEALAALAQLLTLHRNPMQSGGQRALVSAGLDELCNLASLDARQSTPA